MTSGRAVLVALLVAHFVAACGGDSSGPTVAGVSETARESTRETPQAAATASATTARYVRFEAVSEVNGNPWASVAEFNLFDPGGVTIPRDGWSASADSQETVGENAVAGHAIDGDPYSFWHTQWQNGSPALPHALTVDLGMPRALGGFKYLPRQVGVNGRIAAWRFSASSDATNWTLLSQGTFAGDETEKTVVLSATNQPPSLAAIADRSDGVGQSVTQAIPATDPDGDALTYSASGLPPGVALSAATIFGTPAVPGTYAVTVKVSDGRGGVASRAFAWTIASAVAAAGATVQYVRFEAVSEVNGNPWTSVAEFNLVDNSGATISRSGWTVSADSQETSGEYAPASHAVDGDAGSFWHTQWQGGSAPLPHALTINLGNPSSVAGFRYLPRQVGVNGRIAGWRFYTSADGSTWAQVGQGTFANTGDEQAVATASTIAPAPTTPVPSATRAARIAAFASGPLVAGDPWRASQGVTVDAVRRLVSGQHLVYTQAGTTGSVEPALGGAVQDGRPIVDGTAVAYVNGRVTSATRPGAPLVTSAASAQTAGLVETEFATGDSQAPRYAAVQGCRSVSTGTSFIGHYCYANGPAGGSGNATAFAAGPYGAGLSAANVYHSNGWEEEFVVTDSRFGLVFANSASPVDVEIDGVQAQAGPTSSTGSEGWTLVFDYQGVVKRRTVRVISAAGSIGAALRGVALTAQGVVEAGATSKDQVLILGDSFNATVTPTSEAGAQILSYWMQRNLGFGGAINMAVGGSGYVSQNPNTYNVPTLLANAANRSLIAVYAPNVTHVVINAGFNDRTRPVATVQAAALATWRTVRTLLPNARISISDGWSGSSGPDAEVLALAAGLATTFAQWGDSNSRLIHSVGTSAATAYVSGTGNAGTPVVAGNSSVYTSTDAVHPSPAGARYLARRLSDDIAAAWGGDY